MACLSALSFLLSSQSCMGQDTPPPHTPGQSLALPHQGQASAAHVTTAASAAADGTARSPRGAAKQIRRLCCVSDHPDTAITKHRHHIGHKEEKSP
ncbi:hypothetical protein E2C01_033204 [Portunus trituberculatus]|uniref:Secreted protein n=1 Tax=Portunus trituberculatus TaxID=210409 RepID=A0A5B7F354_PORTR|nr:hypothetical protein [Portunus trituberculatus]